MSYDTNPYYNPEALGLKTIGAVEYSSGSYEFDLAVVWKHQDGTFYVSKDSGCSCPSPFEGVKSLSDLGQVSSVLELRKYLQDGQNSYRNSSGQIEALLDNAREEGLVEDGKYW